MRYMVVMVLAATTLVAADKQTITGTITDNLCAKGGHAQMRMGPTDAECTVACIQAHGATYVLYDGKNTYTLSDQKTPEKFAGQKVKVVGIVDVKAKTIQVESIVASK